MSPDTHRRALAALAVAALLVTAGCAGFVGSTGDAPERDSSRAQNDAANPQMTAADGSTGRTISVSAGGSVTADPDKAVLHVAAQATADSASEARERLAENVSSLRSALVDAGIPEDNVTTEYYNIRQVNEPRKPTETGDSGAATRYRATHALSIEIDDVDRVGEIIQVAVDSGATDVRHVEFTLSDATRDELRDTALRQAMSNARADADVIASAAELEIDDVLSASTGGTHVSPYRAEMTAAADAGGAATSIDSGPVTVTAQVQVTYDATKTSE